MCVGQGVIPTLASSTEEYLFVEYVSSVLVPCIDCHSWWPFLSEHAHPTMPCVPLVGYSGKFRLSFRIFFSSGGKTIMFETLGGS